LAAAAALARRRFRVQVLERSSGVGASWRVRYEGLRLNSLGWLSQLPGLPGGWGPRHYPDREEWVAYLERYARCEGLDIRFGTEVQRIDRSGEDWRMLTTQGPMLARRVVVATGMDRVPAIPPWPGRESFAGTLLHSAAFENAAPFRGQDVLVVGANNSGTEIALLLSRGGAARVRLSMRTPPTVLTRFWLGFPAHVFTLLLDRLPTALADSLGRLAQRSMFGDLRRYGIGTPLLGMKSNVEQRGLGPAVDSGFVAAVKSGQIELVSAVERFERGEVVLADRCRVRPKAIVAATGYERGLEPLVGHLRVLDAMGWPLVHGCETLPGAPNLHFIGFRAKLAGPLHQMGRDAEKLARALARQRRGPEMRHRRTGRPKLSARDAFVSRAYQGFARSRTPRRPWLRWPRGA
jgi:putative flavoprotein involved in K+ transport